MSDFDNRQPPERPLSHFERAQIRQNVYIPPRLRAELEDVLKAMAVDEGYSDTEKLDQFMVELTTERDPNDNKNKFLMHYVGYQNKPGPFLKTVMSLKEQASQPGFENVKFDEFGDTRVILRCTELKPLIDVLTQGFINKYSNYRVDYDAIMAEPKTWVDRWQNAGANSGTGGLSGGPGA